MPHKQRQEETLVEIHHAMYGELYRFVLHGFGNEHDVEREVDRIFLQVARELQHDQEDSGYRVWVLSVAYATLRAPWWSGRRKPSPSALAEQSGGEPDQHQMRIEAICHQFRQLKVEERTTLLLQSVYGLSAAELALILELSEGRARTLVEQAADWLEELPADDRAVWPDLVDMWRQQPSDFDLIDRKAASLARVRKRLQQAKLRRRWLPVAGAVAIVALVLTLVYLPSEFKEQAQPESAPDPSVPARIELSAIPAGLSPHEANQYREAEYRNQGYQRVFATADLDLIFDPTGLYAVRVTASQTQAEKKTVLRLTEGQIPHVRGSNGQYLMLSIPEQSGHEIKESLFLFDLTSLTVTPVPTGQGQIGSAVIWQAGDGSLKIVYGLLERGAGELRERMSVISYDVLTGDEQTLHEMSAGGANYLFVEGTTLVINANNELYVVDRAGKRLVAKADSRELTAFSLQGTQLLYIEGLPGAMNRTGTYTGQTKVFAYDLLTGQKKSVLGDRPGDQYVILPHLPEGMLVGNFVVEPGTNGAEPSSDLQGITELWLVNQQWEAKRIYQRGTLWRQHWLDYRGSLDEEVKQLALQAFAESWGLLVDIEQGTAKEYSSMELDQMLQQKN